MTRWTNGYIFRDERANLRLLVRRRPRAHVVQDGLSPTVPASPREWRSPTPRGRSATRSFPARMRGIHLQVAHPASLRGYLALLSNVRTRERIRLER
jgi:hypothetical protein